MQDTRGAGRSVSVSTTSCWRRACRIHLCSGRDKQTEGSQWTGAWFGVKRSTWMRQPVFLGLFFFRTRMWIGSCVSYVLMLFTCIPARASCGKGPDLSHHCQTEQKKAGPRAGFPRWKNRSVQVVTKRKEGRTAAVWSYAHMSVQRFAQACQSK